MGANALPPGLRPAASGYLSDQSIRGLRGCGTRAQFGGIVMPSRSSGKRNATTYRTWERIAGRSGVGSIQFRYANAYAGLTPFASDSSGGEVADLQPITVTASLEINTNPALTNWAPGDGGAVIVPLSFNGGQNALTLPAGAAAWTDELFVGLAAGQCFYVNSHVSEPVAGIWPIKSQGARGLAGGSNEGSNAGDCSLTLTGNGSATSFAPQIPAANTPVVPGSLRIAGTGIAGADNGAGALTGTGIASGSVNYATGAVSLTFSAAPTNGSQVFVNAVGGAAPVDETKLKTKTNYFATGSGAYGNFAPDAVRGRPLAAATPRLRCFALVGDSIAQGAGSSSGEVSWADYCAAQGGFSVMKLAVTGEKAQTFAQAAARHRRLAAIAGSFDRVIGNYATNDLLLGRSLAQIQADLTAIWQALAALCPNGAADIWWCTTIPRTTRPGNVALVPASGPYTAAGAAYGAGSVAGGSPSGRNALNAWLYGQVGTGIGGVIDLAAAVELNPSSRAGAGSGQWADVATDSSDGTHPSQSAHQTKIPALVGPTGSAPSPVWSFPS